MGTCRQGRESQMFTPCFAITAFAHNAYDDTPRPDDSSNIHLTPPDMSQGLNNFCSTMLYHQHDAILPPYSPARPWRRVHHGNTAFSSFVAAASAAAPCPSSNPTSNGLPSFLQATPAPCSVQGPSGKILPRHLLAYRRQPPTYPRTYSFVSPSLSGRHSGGT